MCLKSRDRLQWCLSNRVAGEQLKKDNEELRGMLNMLKTRLDVKRRCCCCDKASVVVSQADFHSSTLFCFIFECQSPTGYW